MDQSDSISEDLIEEFSRSTSLTVFEIHRAAESIIPGYLLANMMSPTLWEWQNTRPMMGDDNKLRATNRRLKDLQRQFHWYSFTNDLSKPGGDNWGLLNFDDEEKRLGKEFIQTIRKDYDETLKYLLDLDTESQFGQITLQDFYKEGYFPRLKNETIEAMNAYRHISLDGKGSGKCVALAMLWASSLAVCGQFPLDQIVIVANKAHLFIFLDDGESVHLFNNAKWYNSTRINNGSELAETARSVATGSDVMFFYCPGKGMCDIYNKRSEIDRETIQSYINRFSEFLGAPLQVSGLDEVTFQVKDQSLPDPSAHQSPEDFRNTIYNLAEQNTNSHYEHAKYAYRDWENTAPQVYAHAAMREYEVGERAKTIESIDDAIEIVRNIKKQESIYLCRNRIALPDETLLFNTGNDRDRALLLFSLIKKSKLQPRKLFIGFSKHSSYVQIDDIWIDVMELEPLDTAPADITHLFDHQKSWSNVPNNLVSFSCKQDHSIAEVV